MEKQIVGLLEHVEILSQNISELQFPANLTLSNRASARQSLIAIQELQEKIRKYQSVAFSLNRELKNYVADEFI